MSENPIMALLLDHNSFVGTAEMVEADIEPLDEQMSLDIGDVAIVATANTPLEREFTVVKVIDPEESAETYPDWEERWEVNRHVLCEAFSAEDREISLGWFSRVKLLPITQEEYTEALGWLEDGFPEDRPAWVEKHFLHYTDAMADRAPEIVPRAVTCPNCQSRNVALVVNSRREYQAKAGVVTKGGVEMYVPITDPENTYTHVGRLRCLDCNSPAELTDEEWALPES